MKVCFVYPSWTNEKTLEVYRKMTPRRSGVWKDMVGVTDEKEADYCVIIDYANHEIPAEKAIYVGAHPYIEGYSGYYSFKDKKCVAKLDLKDTFGFGEWWLKHDYDYLTALKPMEKTKNCCCFLSNNIVGGYGKEQRKPFAERIQSFVDIFGKIKGIGFGQVGDLENYWFGKEGVLSKYRHSIEIDIGKTKHYFSERVFDSLLMWCMPLYWGSTNLEEYLPKDSFKYIDLYGDGKDIIGFIGSNLYEHSLKPIAEARDLLLNKYQIWARIHELIFSL